ncbi:MAG: ferritin-like domain-containing protein [Dehalococcoides mccartyi]|uniref:ferritin-like domain-containing protein n=1 Tax=Dehalococcoides mccartyi TaxID=61435 RepID=UPI0030F5B7AA
MSEKINSNAAILELLNQALVIEYTMIIHYPRIASAMPDEHTRKLSQLLGSASMAHFDTVTSTITKLGGIPNCTFEPFPEDLDLKTIFEIQLDKERKAAQLHNQIAGLITDFPLREKFKGLVKDEFAHARIVEEILSKLEQ